MNPMLLNGGEFIDWGQFLLFVASPIETKHFLPMIVHLSNSYYTFIQCNVLNNECIWYLQVAFFTAKCCKNAQPGNVSICKCLRHPCFVQVKIRWTVNCTTYCFARETEEPLSCSTYLKLELDVVVCLPCHVLCLWILCLFIFLGTKMTIS